MVGMMIDSTGTVGMSAVDEAEAAMPFNIEARYRVEEGETERGAAVAVATRAGPCAAHVQFFGCAAGALNVAAVCCVSVAAATV